MLERDSYVIICHKMFKVSSSLVHCPQMLAEVVNSVCHWLQGSDGQKLTKKLLIV